MTVKFSELNIIFSKTQFLILNTILCIVDSDSCSESDKGETSDDVSNFEGDLPPVFSWTYSYLSLSMMCKHLNSENE